jgi:tetratricopeptide (TPR) repeat protein
MQSMEELSQYKDDYINFLEGGFIAINQADENSAMKLFKACDLLRPDLSLTEVGRGYLHLHKLELKQAIAIFEEVLHKDPVNELAQTLLGIALSLTPDQGMKGEKILETMGKQTADSQVKKVCHTTLDFVDHFIKKAPGPAEVKKK